MTTTKLREIADRLASEGVRSVKLSGGEPTVRNDLPNIIDMFASHGLSSTIITNGIRMKADVVDSILKSNGKVKFSIHFPDDRNDLILQNRSFSKISRNIDHCVAVGVPVAINTVVSRTNISEIRNMVSYAVSLGCEKISFIPLVFRGDAVKNIDTHEMNGSIYRDIISSVSSLSLNLIEVRIIDIRKRDYWVIENDGSLWIERDTESRDEIVLNSAEWSA